MSRDSSPTKPLLWVAAILSTWVFLRPITIAGLTRWRRLFHIVRASRKTELVERFPVQVMAAWLVNTTTIAIQHYLRTTDEHFAKAMTGDQKKAVWNPMQYVLAEGRTASQSQSIPIKKPQFERFTTPCKMPQWRIGDSNRSGFVRKKPRLSAKAAQNPAKLTHKTPK